MRAGGLPETSNVREGALLAFAYELLKTNRLAQATFDHALAQLGLELLVNVTGVIGYYGLVAMTLNAFAMRPE